uniref:Uncharacterized protein n=1 Tax=viral metagenome TaxID=1070528 RepID=A0A6C0LI25_9ZZZZ
MEGVMKRNKIMLKKYFLALFLLRLFLFNNYSKIIKN